MGVVKNVGGVFCADFLAEKNLPYLISEEQFAMGEKNYFRRDYSDGLVELYHYNGERGFWVVEGYRDKEILGMSYDFEWCLSSKVLCGLYLESVKIIKDKKYFPVFSC
jgi:hypothetical protein